MLLLNKSQLWIYLYSYDPKIYNRLKGRTGCSIQVLGFHKVCTIKPIELLSAWWRLGYTIPLSGETWSYNMCCKTTHWTSQLLYGPTSHTRLRARDHCTSSTLIGGKRRSRSKFTSHYAWGTNGVCECKINVRAPWFSTWHWKNHVSCSLALFSRTTSWM